MTASLRVLKTSGLWLCLAGVLLMITGDGPSDTIRPSMWQTPLPFLAWRWLYIVLLFVGGLCFAAGVGVKPARVAFLRVIAKPLALLLGAFFLSTLFSDVPRISIRWFEAVLCIVSASTVFALLVQDNRFRRAFGPVVAVAILLLGARVILWRYDEGLNTEAFQMSNNAWVGKLQVTWVLNLFAPLLLAWSIGVQKRGLAALYASTWLLAGAATYALVSRMGLIVFGITTAAVSVLTLNRSRRTLAILIGAAVVGAILVGRTEDTARFVVTTILEPDRNPGVEMRLGIWRDAIRLFRSRPITGHGLGTYDVTAYALPGNTASLAFREKGWHAHNVYLHVLAETGLLGLVAWCYLWFSILVALWRAWKRADPSHRPPLAGAFGAIAAFLLLSVTEVLIGARVHASFRMNLTLGLIVVLALSECARATKHTSPANTRSQRALR
jgi:O-antigen ligase